jgi:hypothetical protein
MEATPSLPTAQDIARDPDDLDGRAAVDQFLGKSLAEAEALFARGLGLDDLRWMSLVGFSFYVQAAIAHLKSDAAVGNWYLRLVFLPTIERQFEAYESAIKAANLGRRDQQLLEREIDVSIAVMPQVVDAVRYVIDNWSKFGQDTEEDVTRPRYSKLLKRMQNSQVRRIA